MLKIVTLKHDYVFHGEEETLMRQEIDRVFSGEANWTAPVIFKDGSSVEFNLNHIISIEQK